MQEQLAVGNLGNDPELRTLPNSDRKVASFSIASNDRRGGQKVTTWFKVNAYGGTAQACFDNLKKGSLVQVQGPLKAEAYIRDKSDGKPAVSLTIDARNVTFLTRSGGNGSSATPAEAGTGEVAGEGAIKDDDVPF